MKRTSKHSLGFTLIELMVTVAIVALLASIALPAYTNQIRKSRRTEAKTALLDLAGREERLFSTTNSYSQNPADLGYGNVTLPMSVGSGYYTVNITANFNAAANPPATFLLTATPINAQAQDTTCVSLTVDQSGRQSATDSSGADSTSSCWK